MHFDRAEILAELVGAQKDCILFDETVFNCSLFYGANLTKSRSRVFKISNLTCDTPVLVRCWQNGIGYTVLVLRYWYYGITGV